MRAVLGLALLSLLAALGTARAEAAEVFGVWLTEAQDAHVEIYRCTDPAMGAVCGRVVWIKDAVNPDRSPAPSIEGVHDVYNPDPALRSRKLLGLDFMWDFKADPDNPGAFYDGHIYNAQDGKTYRAKMSLKNDNTLLLRGYVLITLFGQSETWTRIR